MNITQIDQALAEHFTSFKEQNGGKKTSPVDKYSFKSLRYSLKDENNNLIGKYFLGRGSLLAFFRKNVASKNSKYYFEVETIIKFKDKNRPVEVLDTIIFEYEPRNLATEITNDGDTTAELEEKQVTGEEERIKTALEQSNFVKAQAAKILGISVDVLRNRIKKYNIVIPQRGESSTVTATPNA